MRQKLLVVWNAPLGARIPPLCRRFARRTRDIAIRPRASLVLRNLHRPGARV